jgi:HD-like signal output (HDOD) protein/GGDEF domain-containing protein
MNETASLLERIASRAITLYSRPTVAMEVVQLTEQPHVDARAIKECVEKDPALTSKILRVVNSSLYGLKSPVADLNQALGLLGIKPLKLLVLGFSLPDALFAEVAAKQLQWYWTNTLTRAVAARLISEQMWKQPGDEAFIAGLLQDLGILVLIRELGEPYTRFLAGVIEERCSLDAMERDTVRFDHVQLSAALLTRWRLPQRLVDAIAAPRQIDRLAQLKPPQADLPQIMHLADMLVQLLAQRRLNVLPHLMEAGEAYRGLTKQQLAELVRNLQPQVEQLADVLSLELTGGRDYMQTLVEAHERLGVLAEELTGALHTQSADDPAYAALLEHSRDLSRAMQSFLQCDEKIELENALNHRWGQQHAAHELPGGNRESAMHVSQVKNTAHLLRKLSLAGNRCRERRQELSLLLIEPHVGDDHDIVRVEQAARQARQAIRQACAVLDPESVTLISVTPDRMAAILCNCERRAAVGVAQNAIAQLGHPDDAAKNRAHEPPVTLSAGIATACCVPRNFDPTNLLESAERCLSAARACGISTVKSIEV